MGQIDEDFYTFTNDFVGLLPVEIDHETHPARVVFVAWVVESLTTWRVFHTLDYTTMQYHVNSFYVFAILTVVML
jgi:hypothetical protein